MRSFKLTPAVTPLGQQSRFASATMHILKHRKTFQVDFRKVILFLCKSVIRMYFEDCAYSLLQSAG